MSRLAAFPARSRLRWRRLDVPGHEDAEIARVASGWRVHGTLDVHEAGVQAHLAYRIAIDDGWRTREVHIDGEANGTPTHVLLLADGAGLWTSGGAPIADVAGALDIDLGFTPLTNTLPIRRLDLEVGTSADVITAWVRFPELRLEPLVQTYTREAPHVFRYHALVDGTPFTARLDTDEAGRVRHYEGLWTMESCTDEPPPDA